ncbi:uL30 family ribosomal protein [Candidatus Woesearchaeota archaeon]|nr:uL30 family ribosomal protein [Candidatus Woesearchaeota archaeon]
MSKIAIIRIRGDVNLRKPIRDTLKMLRLYKKNYCTVYDSTPNILGMINKVKDYVTWGEINDESLKLLKEKRGEKTKNKQGKEVTKPFFRLSPPRKGFGRKGIKLPFKIGGALGNRKEKINDLIKRMI